MDYFYYTIKIVYFTPDLGCYNDHQGICMEKNHTHVTLFYMVDGQLYVEYA